MTTRKRVVFWEQPAEMTTSGMSKFYSSEEISMTNQEKPLVTIAIPTYNRAGSYLQDALQSAVKQSYPTLEILVSDNCSTDHTEQLVKAFDDPRIRYVKHQQNIGHAKNFNFCIDQARGDYFLLLQDDDYIDEDFIDTCLQTVNYALMDIGVIRAGTRYVDSYGQVLGEWANTVGGRSADEFLLAYVSFTTGIYLCSTLFSTQRLREIGGLHSKHYLLSDVMAVAKLSSRYGRKDIRECKSSNRKHPNELSFSVKIKEWCEESVLMVETMSQLASEKEMAQQIQKAGRNFIFRHNYNLAKKEKLLANRVKAFLLISKSCGYLFSLGRFLKYAVFGVLNAVKRRLKQWLIFFGYKI